MAGCVSMQHHGQKSAGGLKRVPIRWRCTRSREIGGTREGSMLVDVVHKRGCGRTAEKASQGDGRLQGGGEAAARAPLAGTGKAPAVGFPEVENQTGKSVTRQRESHSTFVRYPSTLSTAPVQGPRGIATQRPSSIAHSFGPSLPAL